VILTEVQDIRTRAWVIERARSWDLLLGKNYCWYSLKADGSLQPAADGLDSYINLVALPTRARREHSQNADRDKRVGDSA